MILYQMIEGTSPFSGVEEGTPDHLKFVSKKISKTCKGLIKAILNSDDSDWFTMENIGSHEWLQENK